MVKMLNGLSGSEEEMKEKEEYENLREMSERLNITMEEFEESIASDMSVTSRMEWIQSNYSRYLTNSGH